nr:MAG TPA: hypothetical protein [Caudoviricetes sp.]
MTCQLLLNEIVIRFPTPLTYELTKGFCPLPFRTSQ